MTEQQQTNETTEGRSELSGLVSCPIDGKRPIYKYSDGLHWYGRGGTGWMVNVWGATKEASAERWNALFGS